MVFYYLTHSVAHFSWLLAYVYMMRCFSMRVIKEETIMYMLLLCRGIASKTVCTPAHTVACDIKHLRSCFYFKHCWKVPTLTTFALKVHFNSTMYSGENEKLTYLSFFF